MALTFPFGYGSTRLTLSQMMSKRTVALLDPEFRRRVFAMQNAAAAEGVDLGFGTGWRIQPDPPPPGFAKPGNSHHESMPAGSNTATAFAADMVPAKSWNWMEANVHRFGLRTFRHVNNEPWHVQPKEIPAGRRYRREPYHLPRILLPGDQPPPPDARHLPTPVGSPMMRQGSTDRSTVIQGVANEGRVSWLQAVIGVRLTGYYNLETVAKIQSLQRVGGLTADGVYGPQTEAKFREWRGR